MMWKSVHPPGRWILPLVATFTLFGCGTKSVEKESKRSIPDEYVEGSFVVTVTAEMDEKEVGDLGKAVGTDLGCGVREPEKVNWGEGAIALSEEMANTYNVRYENCDFSRKGTEAILTGLAEGEGVLLAEAEASVRAIPTLEDDPYKDSQGHLDFIRRDEACNLAQKNQKPVIVAVIDTGVDLDHPDLEDILYKNAQGEIVGANFVGSGSSMPPDRNFDDGGGHGTHVAGLIAASSGNGKGVVGVGSCVDVRIMPIRVLNDEGRGSSLEIDRGIKWAADHGAQIINLSLGYTHTSYSSSGPNFRRSLFETVAAQNVVVFAAAGNDGYENGGEGPDGGHRWHFPSSYDQVISVAATNNSGRLTSFSNYGKRVDIAAPGQSVLSTLKTGGYGRMSGTSMATPVAAGAYALALASAEPGLESGFSRIDSDTAAAMLDDATLSGAFLSSSKVAAGGVIDVEKLVSEALERFPADQPDDEEPVDLPSDGDQPDDGADQPTDIDDGDDVVDDEPEAPVDSDPAPIQTMSFEGLGDGDRPGWPQELKVVNLPKGTAAVYFYWGNDPWSFSRVRTKSYYTYAKDQSRWYLYGNRTLRAVAVNEYGRILKIASVNLRGY